MRSLLAFRHRNPVAKLVSTVLAFAMAVLLVVGTGAAYADDTTPPTDTTATDTTATETTPPAESTTSDPSTDPSTGTPEGDSTTTDTAPTPPESDSPAPRSSTPRTSTSKTSDTFAATIAALVGDCFGTGGTISGGFEIDGNTCVDSPVPDAPAVRPTDWDTPFGHKVDDQFEPGDTNGFTGGSSKVALDPLGWLIDNAANTKADVKTAWAGSRVFHTVPSGGAGDGHVFTYFAFERHPKDFPGANGDVAYQVEYNQLPNQETASGLEVPHRSPGDLLVLVNQSGSTTLNVSTDGAGIYEYKAGHPGATGCFVADTADGPGSWCPKDTQGAFVSSVNAESSFGEAAIDITTLFGAGNCSGTFGVINMRSSSSTETTSAMQDYILPVDATTPSTCGSLTIEKKGLTGDTLIPGAAYSIVDDPRPGGGGGTALWTTRVWVPAPPPATTCSTALLRSSPHSPARPRCPPTPSPTARPTARSRSRARSPARTP